MWWIMYGERVSNGTGFCVQERILLRGKGTTRSCVKIQRMW
ncbi:protein ORF0 [Pigeon adenovirus 2]|uniref:Protein ORF0 n=1 Tax=Pigeon adenovirus 2 TaxID=1907767 RepID=A0A1D8QMA3_9ADEN|nr:protein ORF0 [Pigeon adenovirus 2]AOW42087.1 protein ORF0 [Pigeon adenovirus 2]